MGLHKENIPNYIRDKAVRLGLESMRQAGASVAEEIEVTPAMIEAGARIVADFFEVGGGYLAEITARAVFEAMLSASSQECADRN